VAVSEDGAAPVQVIDVASGSSPSLAGSYGSAPDFTFAGFGVSSTLGAAQGELGGQGNIFYTPTVAGSTHTLDIWVSDTGFTNPAGPNYVMGSTSGYTATPDDGGSFFFQSFATAGAVPYGNFGATGTPSPGHSYSPISSNDNFDEPATNFSASPASYTLTEHYQWTASPEGNLFNPNAQTTASQPLQPTSVPEPSTMALVGLGAVGFVAYGLRRRACRS
jgi:hypothetical protein